MGRKRNSSYPVDAEFSRRPGLYKKIVRSGGLDPELVYGNEMESPPKKSCAPDRRAEMIALIKEVIKHQGDKALLSLFVHS